MNAFNDFVAVFVSVMSYGYSRSKGFYECNMSYSRLKAVAAAGVYTRGRR